MAKPVRITLLVSLWVCGSLLIPSAVGLAGTFRPPALQLPGAQFGGMYQRSSMPLGDPCLF